MFYSLKDNTTLKYLDVSWNPLGNKNQSELARAMSEALHANRHLFHLNISYIYLTASSLEVIAESLRLNHTLYGIHIEGNEGYIDANGFLIPDPTAIKASHSILSRNCNFSHDFT